MVFFLEREREKRDSALADISEREKQSKASQNIAETSRGYQIFGPTFLFRVQAWLLLDYCTFINTGLLLLFQVYKYINI